jgi:hypothetical protein
MKIEDVTNWTWESTKDHRGRVPIMTAEERAEWVRLSDERPRTSHERALFSALDRKLRYRAERDLDEGI